MQLVWCITLIYFYQSLLLISWQTSVCIQGQKVPKTWFIANIGLDFPHPLPFITLILAQNSETLLLQPELMSFWEVASDILSISLGSFESEVWGAQISLCILDLQRSLKWICLSIHVQILTFSKPSPWSWRIQGIFKLTTSHTRACDKSLVAIPAKTPHLRKSLQLGDWLYL